ncbi:MAG: hypothetical protein HWN66_08310 [Candidatus Helarchaeota archaeon]|nr:hypothetical protein [Candidatus Helarchaeota archaeon]
MTGKNKEGPDQKNADFMNKQFKRLGFRIECLGGATNAAGALGNGRLTVGISPWSELIYFRWPTQSYHDHLRYFTKSKGLLAALFPKDMRWGKEAPSLDWIRYGRPYEAYPGLGAKGGIYFRDGSLSWFGDETWTSSRRYVPETGPILNTQLQRNDVKIEIRQWVDWHSDLLVQEFQIQAQSAQKFFYYGTFAPSNKLDRNYGVPDSKKRGFATIYLPKNSAILYFLPNIKDKGHFIPKLNQELTPELIDNCYPDGGIFISMSMLTPADGFQVGADRRGRSISKNAPLGAYENAQAGKLNRNRGFIGPADAGLGRDLKGDDLKVVILTTIADTAGGSIKILEDARDHGLEIIERKTIEYWLNLMNRVDIPPQARPSEKRVSLRSIANLFIGRDPDSGAIVAAPTRQPPYRYDWPRDGTFYDLALDLAGFPEVVEQHLDFYRRTQRNNRLSVGLAWLLRLKSPFYSPRGHWHSNLYTNGKKGALSIIPFEIDETALIVWDLWRHEQFVPEADRPTYQEKYLETLQLGADGLEAYVNRRKGWTKRSFEDDNLVPLATLHGAASVLAGLAAAMDAGQRWGADPNQIERWSTSATALRNGILRRIENKSILNKGGWRGIRWSLFPAPVFESYDDPRAELIITELVKDIQNMIAKKNRVYHYLGERVFILGVVSSKLPQFRTLVEKGLDEIVNKIPIEGTDSYGEVTLWIEMPGYPELLAQQRTSIPHFWTGVCTYLAVESFYRPARFLTQIPPIPK